MPIHPFMRAAGPHACLLYTSRRIVTLYAHNSRVYAKVGDKVVGGRTVISLAGDTGNVTGPHLHFEVRVDGTAVDPIANGYVKVK